MPIRPALILVLVASLLVACAGAGPDWSSAGQPENLGQDSSETG